MRYLVKYTNKYDLKRHTILCEGINELIDVLIETKDLCVDKEYVNVETGKSVQTEK